MYEKEFSEKWQEFLSFEKREFNAQEIYLSDKYNMLFILDPDIKQYIKIRITDNMTKEFKKAFDNSEILRSLKD
jgi:hypothetical protein